MNVMEEHLTCLNLEKIFPLYFIDDLRDNDKKLILQCIKNFKNPDYNNTNIHFLDGRDLRIITSFFIQYGDVIRYYILYFNLYFLNWDEYFLQIVFITTLNKIYF